ncbi:hypothetical protein [Micromonospora sp. NPDC003241]
MARGSESSVGSAPRRRAIPGRFAGRSCGQRVTQALADFTRLDDIERLAGQLRAAYPRIDVLANNAGGVFGDRS